MEKNSPFLNSCEDEGLVGTGRQQLNPHLPAIHSYFPDSFPTLYLSNFRPTDDGGGLAAYVLSSILTRGEENTDDRKLMSHRWENIPPTSLPHCWQNTQPLDSLLFCFRWS